ncbi:unnamed protein product [Symbiodinium sp. CCMP2592]|nr:unnamed protein product [Symbiodinium sp. CCMP2592]
MREVACRRGAPVVQAQLAAASSSFAAFVIEDLQTSLCRPPPRGTRPSLAAKPQAGLCLLYHDDVHVECWLCVADCRDSSIGASFSPLSTHKPTTANRTHEHHQKHHCQRHHW